MRLDTGGGLLGITILVIAGIYAIALLPDLIESISGILWWSFGK
jgi:hypothetical protein